MGKLDSQDLDKHPVAATAELSVSVPIIDVGGLHSDDAKAAIRAIADACREWGFFQVVNHGVSETLINDTWRHTRQFFHLPRDTKESVLRTRENPWGYYNNELTKNQRDKKEVFDYTTEGVDPIYRSENRWPEIDSDFRATMLAYLDACTTLSLHLIEAPFPAGVCNCPYGSFRDIGQAGFTGSGQTSGCGNGGAQRIRSNHRCWWIAQR